MAPDCRSGGSEGSTRRTRQLIIQILSELSND